MTRGNTMHATGIRATVLGASVILATAALFGSAGVLPTSVVQAYSCDAGVDLAKLVDYTSDFTHNGALAGWQLRN